MKLIEPEAKWIGEATNSLELIELAGRNCYKSEPKGDARGFVERLIKRGHMSVLEHSNKSVLFPFPISEVITDMWPNSKFFDFKVGDEKFLTNTTIVTGNLRSWLELGEGHSLDWFLKSDIYRKIPDEHKRFTAYVVCDRAVSHEIVRHRALSFSQESQRYCDYSGEVAFVRPCWLHTNLIKRDLEQVEKSYKFYRSVGWKPEEARYFLPNATATSLYITGSVDERGWQNFFRLRDHKAAHPSIREIAAMLNEQREF